MPVYKDKERKTWYAKFYYTDWQGALRQKKKRGFEREKDAKAFEAEFLKKEAQSCNMNFGSMTELYMADMENRLKENTMCTKRCLVDGKILPFFKALEIDKITPAHVRKWQAELLAKEKSQTYVKTINNQLSAIFNYACRYYGLRENPARLAGSVGRKDADAMKFWTVEEFNRFIPCVPKFPARVGLSVLFWTGLRIGELLALGAEDINLEAGTLSVTKSFQSIAGREVVTEPKTKKSRRVLPLPDKLCVELREYMAALYEPKPGDRLFPFTKSYFHKQMEAACAVCGIEKIRLHDLRHSHASLLIHLGVPIILVSERLGHENIETTLRTYSHLYPAKNDEAMKKLDDLMR
ncbi:MAG: site-specific integrase [Oscillibacter sp.]